MKGLEKTYLSKHPRLLTLTVNGQGHLVEEAWESKAKAGRSRGIKIRRLGEHGFEKDSLSLEGGEPYVYMHV